jgi:hypothetical protein
MLTDYFLKFSSREEAINTFLKIPNHTYIPYDINGNELPVDITPQGDYFAIDEVGAIYKNDGVYNHDGQVITPPTKIDGYHCNYRIVYGDSPEIPISTELEPFLVNPRKPSRVFF